MNTHYRSQRVRDPGDGKDVRIDYRRHTVVLVSIKRFGRVTIGYAEITFRRFDRPVCCCMHGNTRVPQNQRKEDRETEILCGDSHTNSDQQSRELFRRA